MSRVHDPEFYYKEDTPEELWYHSTLISLIVSHYFKTHIITFSLPITITLLSQHINGRIKVRDDTKKNNILIQKEVQGFNNDLPTVYILHSHKDHFMWVKSNSFIIIYIFFQINLNLC